MRTTALLALLLPAVSGFGYLPDLTDDGCSEGHDLIDCASMQVCQGCSSCADTTDCWWCMDLETVFGAADTCNYEESDDNVYGWVHTMWTCNDAAYPGVAVMYTYGIDSDSGCTMPTETGYHMCEYACSSSGDDDGDDDDDDDDCGGAYTSYGGFYCSNYEVAMRSGCTDGSTCCEVSWPPLDSHCFDTSSCSYNEAGQTLWDTLSSSMEGDSFDCFKPQGEDNYMSFYCDPGNGDGSVQRTIFQESDSTCSGTPMYSQLEATCEGDCDRRRLGARGQKPTSSPSFAKRSVRNLRVKPRAVQVDVVKRQN